MIDIHVHYFPKKIFEAIWHFFETKSHGLWQINYKEHGQDLIDSLKSFGIKRFTTLVYAHKKDVARYLNDFIHEESNKHPELIPFGTIFAGDGNVKTTARDLFETKKFYGIKLHPFVSKEQLDDMRLFPAYEIMQDLGKVLVCHPGSGPVYSEKDGANRLHTILKSFPKLRVVVAHCGAFEYGDYNTLAKDFEHVYFDTAMNCVHTHVFENNCPGPEFFKEFQDRLLFGSDFPNIPYDYREQINSLQRFHLGPDIEQKIFTTNAERLLGL